MILVLTLIQSLPTKRIKERVLRINWKKIKVKSINKELKVGKNHLVIKKQNWKNKTPEKKRLKR